jgi:hypothetical protein
MASVAILILTVLVFGLGPVSTVLSISLAFGPYAFLILVAVYLVLADLTDARVPRPRKGAAQ